MLQLWLWPASGRWAVFSSAVFLCAWFGGFASGLAATLVATIVMWWFFVPPEHAIVKPDGAQYGLALLFLAMSTLMNGILRGRRRIAIELSRKQRLLQGILDYSPNAIVIKDIESRYILVNQAFGTLTGTTIELATDHTDRELFSRTLAERVLGRDKQVRDTHAPVVFEEKVDTGPDRYVLITEFPILDEAEKVVAIGAIQTDISQRKHDEEVLRQAMEDLRTAQHVAHVGSWRWDFRTNRATWSDELYRIFGIDPVQPPTPLVNPGLKLLTADSILRATRAIEKIRKDGEPFELDLEFTRPDGATRWCTACGEAIRAPDGSIAGINATAADITHIKELERLREEWTSMIAHDLRQPIGVIAMASELMPELRDNNGEKRQDVLRRIQASAHVLKRMVDDLLDMSLLEAHRLKLERKWIDPRAVVQETVEQLNASIGNRVKICETGPLPSVFADPERIEQVLGNVLSNAAKYGEPGTGIDVHLASADGDIRISVTNHGKGIGADELPRLFDRFMRSKMTRATGVAGLGLGLHISKGIVESHGGRMWAESEPGKTTTFHVSLPVAVTRLEAA
jgi:PAS domain S-box-containing protein